MVIYAGNQKLFVILVKITLWYQLKKHATRIHLFSKTRVKLMNYLNQFIAGEEYRILIRTNQMGSIKSNSSKFIRKIECSKRDNQILKNNNSEGYQLILQQWDYDTV